MILATGLTTRGYKVGFTHSGLCYKCVIIVINDHNDRGLYYKRCDGTLSHALKSRGFFVACKIVAFLCLCRMSHGSIII